MRLTDTLIAGTKRVNQENRKKNDVQQDWDEDEETMLYHEAPRWGYLNDSKGLFQDGRGDGINSAPDVFARTTVFHVSGGSVSES